MSLWHTGGWYVCWKRRQVFYTISEAGDVGQADNRVRELSPDVLLLDIQMRGGNGFDVLAQLAKDVPVVIFVTAFDHHAFQAFEASAVDYITKPIDPSRLHSALARARLAIESPQQRRTCGRITGNNPCLASGSAQGQGAADRSIAQTSGRFHPASAGK